MTHTMLRTKIRTEKHPLKAINAKELSDKPICLVTAVFPWIVSFGTGDVKYGAV